MHAAQECGMCEGGLEGTVTMSKATLFHFTLRLTGWPLISSPSQNISQLEIFGDMSTPPDITSPSVSGHRCRRFSDLLVFSSLLPSNNLFFPLLFSFRPTFTARRPPCLPPTPWTPRRACSHPLSCLLPSILLLCPQVGPRCFSLLFFHYINGPKRRIK